MFTKKTDWKMEIKQVLSHALFVSQADEQTRQRNRHWLAIISNRLTSLELSKFFSSAKICVILETLRLLSSSWYLQYFNVFAFDFIHFKFQYLKSNVYFSVQVSSMFYNICSFFLIQISALDRYDRCNISVIMTNGII